MIAQRKSKTPPPTPRKPATPRDGKERVRPSWKFPRELVQSVTLRAAAEQKWAEDWAEQALREKLNREDR